MLKVVEEGKCFLPKEEEPVNTQDGPIIPVPDGIRPVMKKHRIEVKYIFNNVDLDSSRKQYIQ